MPPSRDRTKPPPISEATQQRDQKEKEEHEPKDELKDEPKDESKPTGSVAEDSTSQSPERPKSPTSVSADEGTKESTEEGRPKSPASAATDEGAKESTQEERPKSPASVATDEGIKESTEERPKSPGSVGTDEGTTESTEEERPLSPASVATDDSKDDSKKEEPKSPASVAPGGVAEDSTSQSQNESTSRSPGTAGGSVDDSTNQPQDEPKSPPSGPSTDVEKDPTNQSEDKPKSPPSGTSAGSEGVLMDQPQNQLFLIESIPGKGKGMVARVDIAKGTRILEEQSVILMTEWSKTSPVQMHAIIFEMLRSRPQERKLEFISLHNAFPGPTAFAGIAKSNFKKCGINTDIRAWFPVISRINHSCDPNANLSWDDDDKVQHVYVGMDIKAGEEICILYSPNLQSRDRRAWLQKEHRFDCICQLCTSSPAKIRESDERRAEMERLDGLMEDLDRRMKTPALILDDCRQLVNLSIEEYSAPDMLLARAYYEVSKLCATHSDQARASCFAYRA